VDPNHLPAEPSGEGDDIFSAAQALRGLTIPKREHQSALVNGFDATFVVALFARTIAVCNFNRGCLAQNQLGTRPGGCVEVLAELFPRQRQQNAKRQLQLNAALGKQQVPPAATEETPYTTPTAEAFRRARKSMIHFLHLFSSPSVRWPVNPMAMVAGNLMEGSIDSPLALLFPVEETVHGCVPVCKLSLNRSQPGAASWPSSKGHGGRQ